MAKILVVAAGSAMRRAIAAGLVGIGCAIVPLEAPARIRDALDDAPRVVIWDAGYEDHTEEVVAVLQAAPALRVVYLTYDPWALPDQDRVRCLMRPVVPEALRIATLRELVAEALGG
jgi:hypothetical protein